MLLGSRNWEPTILLGSNRFYGAQMASPTFLKVFLRVKTCFCGQGLTKVKVRFRVKVWIRYLTVVVRVRSWRVHYVNDESPQRYKNNFVCVFVCVCWVSEVQSGR